MSILPVDSPKKFVALLSQSPNQSLNSLVLTWAYCLSVRLLGLPLGASNLPWLSLGALARISYNSLS